MIDPSAPNGMHDMAARLKAAGITPDTLAMMKALDDPIVRARAEYEDRAKPWKTVLELEERLEKLKNGETAFGPGAKALADSFKAAEDARARKQAIDPFGTSISTVARALQDRADQEKQLGPYTLDGAATASRDMLDRMGASEHDPNGRMQHIEFFANPAVERAAQDAADRRDREIEALDLARRQTAASEAAIQSAREGEAAAIKREKANAALTKLAIRVAVWSILAGLLIGAVPYFLSWLEKQP